MRWRICVESSLLHVRLDRSAGLRAPAGLLVHEEGDVQLAARVVEAGQAPPAGLRHRRALRPVVRHHQLHRLRDVRQTLLDLHVVAGVRLEHSQGYAIQVRATGSAHGAVKGGLVGELQQAVRQSRSQGMRTPGCRPG